MLYYIISWDSNKFPNRLFYIIVNSSVFWYFTNQMMKKTKIAFCTSARARKLVKNSIPLKQSIILTSNHLYFIGMTCAAFTIFWMRIKLEWHSILFCNLGSIFGLILGTAKMTSHKTRVSTNAYFLILGKIVVPYFNKLFFQSLILFR